MIHRNGLDRGGPYAARSASDKTDDWPLWYVCGPDGRTNVIDGRGYLPFAKREVAEALATQWNREASQCSAS